MPYRCTKCQFLSRTDDNPECKTRKECNFERVTVIHFASSEGSGRVVGSGVKTVMEEDKAIVTPAELKLHCESIDPLAHSTPVRHAATCIDCLENTKLPAETAT